MFKRFKALGIGGYVLIEIILQQEECKRLLRFAKIDIRKGLQRRTIHFWAPLKTVLIRDGGVSRVLTAFGAHKPGALRTVRPHVFAHTLRFPAHGFLALTKNSWFLEGPFRESGSVTRLCTGYL